MGQRASRIKTPTCVHLAIVAIKTGVRVVKTPPERVGFDFRLQSVKKCRLLLLAQSAAGLSPASITPRTFTSSLGN